MNKIIIFFSGLVISGCSTLHIHKGFYLKREKTTANVKSACEGKLGSYGEPVTLKINGKEYSLLVWPKRGFSIVGPIFIPIIPVIWVSSKIDSLGIKVLPKPASFTETNLNLNISKWYLVFNDGTRVSPKLNESETLDSGTTVKNIGGGTWLVFEFPERDVPEEFTLVIDDGVQLKEQQISFAKVNRWHYSPFIFIHTEWPYTHTLPCD